MTKFVLPILILAALVALLVVGLNRDPSYYLPIFIVAGTLYLVALAVIHLLAPRLEPARLEGGA